MTTFTRTSPTSGGEVPAGVTEVGGAVFDLIGLNGVRVVSQLAASTLFEGYFNSGSPSGYRGNPGTIGVQTGFSAAALDALGGGIRELAVRITLFDGDTAAGNFDFNRNRLLVNGVTLGDFSAVETQITSDDGVDLLGSTTGFSNNLLNTGWFLLNDATSLQGIFQALSTSGTLRLQLNDLTPYDNLLDFTQGVDGSLIDIGSAPNVSPLAVADAVSAGEDGTTAIAFTTLRANDTDADNARDTLTLVSVSPASASGATVTIVGGDIVYDPGALFGSLAAGQTAADSFTYTIRDPGGLTSTATVAVTVQGANDAPTATADTVAITAREGIADLATVLLANDVDPDTGDGRRIIAVNATGTVGTLRFNAATGSLSYAADDAASKVLAPGATLSTSFTYTMADAAGATSTATATVTITGSANRAPIAENDRFAVAENQALDGNLLAANGAAADDDPDGDALVVAQVNGVTLGGEAVALASGARVLVEADGDFRYDPNEAFDDLREGETASDSFTYQVADGYGGVATATATFTIEGAGSTRLEIVQPSALAPGETGAATVIYTDATGGSVRPSLLLIQAQGALVADPLTGGFASQALIFTAGGGARVEIPVTLRMAATADVSATLSAAVADEAAAIDWAALKSALRPDSVPADAWDRVFANFTGAVGGTVGTLVAALAQNAALLDRFGIAGGSGVAALGFELEQAGDFGSIAARSATGSLGRGWASLADLALDVGADGAVALDGLADLSGLLSLRAGDAAAYTVSGSVGRAFDLAGNLAAAAPPVRPQFDRDVTGGYGSRVAGFDLTRTATGFALEAGGVTLSFDAGGALLGAATASGETIAVSRDAAGRISGFQSATGATLAFARDADGRVTGITDSGGGALALAYAADGATLASTSGAAGVTRFGYDAAGDLASAARDGGARVDIAYDGGCRLAEIDLGEGAAVQAFTYDATGGYTIADAAARTLAVTLLPGGLVGAAEDAAGVSTELRFGADGTLTGVASSDGSAERFATDALGRLTAITDANDVTVRYTYDGDSLRPSGFIDANDETRSFAYDAAGRLTGVTWADGEDLSFGYDAAGRLTASVNRRGAAIDYSYDAAGRLLSASDSSAGAVDYGYDAAGRLVSMTTAAGETALSYDAAGRVDVITYPDGRSLDYDYDAAGRRSAMTDGDGRTQTYGYDAAGRLETIGDNGGVLVTYGYDVAGNLASETNANGTTTAYAYDAAGRIAEIVNRDAAGDVSSFQRYGYDAGGRRSAMETQDGAWTYGYDASGQLTSAVFASTNAAVAGKSIAYAYDDAGNRVSATEDGVVTAYVTGGLNRYASAGGESFAYDADGNMVSRTGAGGTTTYAYDVANRLSSVTAPDGGVTTYEYDVFGNRSAVVENGVRTAFLVDPFGLGDVVREYAADGSLVAAYAHGLGLASRSDATGADAFYDADAVGSVTGVSGAGGTLANRYAYTPFGTELYEQETLANRFEFNGLFGVEEDATGLSYMRARQYDAGLGRFTGEDPLFQNGDFQNLHRYVGNSPIDYVDPLGLRTTQIGFKGQLSLPGGVLGTLGIGVIWDDNGNVGIYASNGLKVNATKIGNAASASLQVGVNYMADTIYDISPLVSPKVSVTSANRFGFSAEAGKGSFAFGLAIGYGNTFTFGGSSTYVFGLRELLAIYEQFFIDGETNSDSDSEPNNLDPDDDNDGTPDDADPDDDNDGIPDELDDDADNDGDPDVPSDDQTPISPKPTPGGRSDGDPHLSTFDGLAYDFQAVGEFVLARGTGLELQTRQEAVGSNVSVNTATAIRIGDDVVGIYAKQANPLVINGQPVDLAVNETIAVGGGSVYRADFGRGEAFKVYVVTNEAGDGFWVNVYNGSNHLRPFISDERGDDVAGLLGNHDGDRANDIALADGTVIAQPVAAQALYGAFADSWRVTGATSLFVYGAGESTETFTDRGFPSRVVTVADLTAEQRATGEAAARAAGLVPGTVEFDNAVLDVGLTGDEAFAEAIAATPDPEVEPEPLVVQRAPTPFADTATTAEDTLVLIDVLANDTDPEADELLLTDAIDANGGIVTITEGRLAFTPAADFAGETVVTYAVRDPAGNRVTSTVAVTVTAQPDAPRAVGDAVRVAEDGATTLSVAGLLANDSDPDAADLVSFESVAAASAGGAALSIGPSGAIVYDPGARFNGLRAGETGSDSFTYTVRDVGGETATATVAVTIEGANDTPDAVDNGGFTTPYQTALVIARSALLAGDADPDGDPLAIASVQGAVNGTLALDGTNVVFTPAAGYAGPASFTYTVSDGQGGTDTATVTLSVGAAPGTARGTRGTRGDDVLTGGAAGEIVLGRGGDDILSGGGGGDQFRFFGNEIDGPTDRDLIADLDFGEGDAIVFGSYGAGTFFDEPGVDAFTGGAAAIVSSWTGIVNATDASPRVTAARSTANPDNLVLIVANGAQTQEVEIAGGFASYVAAGGTEGVPGVQVRGSPGDNILTGGNGPDIVVGRGGDDILTGGLGADQFRFFAREITGSGDTDTITDLNFAQGDVLVFGTYASGFFTETVGVNAYTGNSAATVSSWTGVVNLVDGSALITARRESPASDALVLMLANGGASQEIVIAGGWSPYLSAGGTEGVI